MNNKQTKKLRKRARRVAAIHVQNSLIESVFFMATDKRRVRDQLFTAAQRHLESSNAAR